MFGSRFFTGNLVRRLICICGIFVGLMIVAAPLAAQSTPVVIAVDTSRSLSRAELARTAASVREVVSGLPAGTPVGLLAFDDTPNWLVEPDGTAAEVDTALTSLTPSGNFTLLNDALFSVARKLPEGGVVLLLTDGRDENSATTVEDVAALCGENHVRIVAMSTGRLVDQLAMRRLALLTDGAYLGKTADAASETVTGAIDHAQQATAADLREAREAEKPVIIKAPEPRQQSQQASAEPISEVPWWLLPGLIALTAAVLATLILIWRSRRTMDIPEVEGDWETDPAITPVGDTEVQDHILDVMPPSTPMAEKAEELLLDPSAYERLPFDGDLDKTCVLDEQPILTVKEPGHALRTFRLKPDRAFAVGRAPKVNTLTLAERTLSGQHFKIVPYERGFVVVDLEATNGTMVNGDRVRARKLESGDLIQAGEVEFEFKVTLQPAN